MSSTPAYRSSLSGVQHGVKSVHEYSGPKSTLAHSALTNRSYAFNFTNREIEEGRHAPSAGAKDTRGQIYGGSIGSSD